MTKFSAPKRYVASDRRSVAAIVGIFLPAVILVAAIAIPATGQNQDVSVGSVAYVKAWRTDLKAGSRVISTVPSGRWASIESISGSHFLVSIADIDGNLVRGWIHRDDVIARGRFTKEEQIKIQRSEATYKQIYNLLYGFGIGLDAWDFLDNARQSVTNAKSVWGPNHPAATRYLEHVAAILEQQNEMTAAKLVREEILATRRSTLPHPHGDTANAMAKLAVLLTDVERQIELYEEAAVIYGHTHGKEHSNYLVVLEQLANVYESTARVAKARACWQEIVPIRQKFKQHPSGLYAALRLADLCALDADRDAAQAAYDNALQYGLEYYRDKKSSAAVWEVMKSQAEFYESHGKTGEAARVYERELKRLADVDAKPFDFVFVWKEFADFHFRHSRPRDALIVYKKASKYIDSLNDADQFRHDVRSIGHRVALCYAMDGEDEQAVRNLYQLLQRHTDAASSDRKLWLYQLGILRARCGALAEAEEALTQSIAIKRDKDPFVIYGRGNVIEFSLDGGPHGGAADSSDWDTKLALGLIHHAADKSQSALEAIDQSRRSYKRYLGDVRANWSYLTEYVERRRREDEGALSTCLSVAVQRAPTNQDWADGAAAWLINEKAFGYEDVIERNRLLRNPEHVDLAKNLRSVRNAIASLTVAGASLENEFLRMLCDRELTLSAHVRLTAAHREAFGRWIELDDLRHRIPSQSLLLTIRLVGSTDQSPLVSQLGKLLPLQRRDLDEAISADVSSTKARHYVACLIPPAGRGNVQLVDLGDADRIDVAVGNVRAKLNDSPSRILEIGEPESHEELQRDLAVLSELLLSPFKSSLDTSRELIISADGDLWLAPFCALLRDQDTYLAETHAIRYLISGRELMVDPDRSVSAPPVVVADPDFDCDSLSLTSNRIPLDAPSNLRGSSASRRQPVHRLPGSATEAQAIQSSLRDFTRYEPRLLLNDKASVDAVKHVRRPSVLVLSTHAYFDSDSASGPSSGKTAQPSFDPHKSRHRDLMEPLLQCGILLAGSNSSIGHAATLNDDGVLTGLEVVDIDLQGTELVVLSACDTGVGKVHRGEGAIGLRQAFQLAGAHSVLATLWHVDDRETVRIVDDFFQNTAKGMTKGQALSEAQRSRIKARREHYGVAHPFYWAAFTLTGT